MRSTTCADRAATCNEIATRVAADMAPVAVGLGRSIGYRNEGGSSVEGRAEILERAVRNLVENALAHSPRGTAIEVDRGTRTAGVGARSRTGIPVALREKVFERFWRADRPARRCRPRACDNAQHHGGVRRPRRDRRCAGRWRHRPAGVPAGLVAGAGGAPPAGNVPSAIPLPCISGRGGPWDTVLPSKSEPMRLHHLLIVAAIALAAAPWRPMR